MIFHIQIDAAAGADGGLDTSAYYAAAHIGIPKLTQVVKDDGIAIEVKDAVYAFRQKPVKDKPRKDNAVPAGCIKRKIDIRRQVTYCLLYTSKSKGDLRNLIVRI